MTDQIIYTAHDLETPLELSFQDTLTALEKGNVDCEHGIMRWGSNYTFLISIEHEDKSFLAIYKPRAGERPLWDFPQGTLCQRETAAFVLSEALGWRLVPPTVMREASRGIGSVQVFISHNPEQHYFNFEADEAIIFPQLQKMAIFDAIANNADRKGGHCLLDAEDKIWGIDHGLTFNAMYKLRTVIWDFRGQSISRDLLHDIEQLCTEIDDPKSNTYGQLETLLSATEIKMLQNRIQRLLRDRIYPLPSSGPNRPWPAI